MKLLLAGVALLTLVAVAPATHAQETPPRVWYGWQTLIADGVAASLVVGGLAIGPPQGRAFVAGGLFTYALTVPAVHFAHGNVGTGFGSFALRVGPPMLVAAAMAGHGTGPALGLAGLSVLLDASALSYQEVDGKPRVRPIARVGARETFVGIGGEF